MSYKHGRALTVIECIKCHIYKPRINFVKERPFKEAFKVSMPVMSVKGAFPLYITSTSAYFSRPLNTVQISGKLSRS